MGFRRSSCGQRVLRHIGVFAGFLVRLVLIVIVGGVGHVSEAVFVAVVVAVAVAVVVADNEGGGAIFLFTATRPFHMPEHPLAGLVHSEAKDFWNICVVAIVVVVVVVVVVTAVLDLLFFGSLGHQMRQGHEEQVGEGRSEEGSIQAGELTLVTVAVTVGAAAAVV